MKRAVGMLSVLLALLTGLNAVTPFVSDSIRAFFSIEPQTASVDDSAEDYTVNDVENTAQKASGKKQVAYDGKKILIYDYNQLLKIGSGKSHKYEDGVSATYSADAEYKLARDIALPRHTAWKLPDGFKGSITGTKQKNRNLYDAQNDRIYVYNPYQLAVMAMDNADSQPVMSGDSTAAEFGKGKVISTDKKGKNYLTYDGDHNYVISASFSSKINEKPESVVSQKAAAEPVGAKAENSAGAADDGRDFPGQVIKKIDGKTYILIGNGAQLRAIGSGKDVYSAIYQVNLVGVHFEPDTSGGEPVMLYGGDADLLQSQNDKKDYGFQEIDDKNSNALKYYASVNQETGKTYLDAGHTSLTQSSDITTGEKYTTTANYIIFRNIDLGGQSRPWKPLMFSGTMYGAKTENGEKLWNGSTNTNATAITATAEVNRPQIQNIYVNTNSIYNDQKLRVNDFIGVGFFATITNQTNASNYGISGGTAVVKNLDLDDVHVENHTNDAVVDETLLNAVTSGLGTVVGALVDALLRVLSLGATSTDLRSTLANLLNARAQDPTIYSTGAFAGRIYGDAVVEDCRVKGTVEVSNVKDRTGGFAGYTEGLTEYSGLSTALGAVSNVLATLLNAVPGLGLGDLVTVLLGNALPIDKLIPTNYIAPHLKNCEVNGLTGDVGTTGTNMAGGFVGQQIGTRIEDCSVTDSNYNVKAKNYGGGFTGLARDAEIKGTLDGVGIDLSSIIQNIHPQSILIDCEINDSEYQVTGENILGGFAGALTSSYAVDCTIDCQQKPVTVHGTGNYAGGFAGYATVGWQSNLGKSENNENSLLGTVKQLVTGLLSEDQAAGQKLLSLMGISPSAILGCQIYSSELNVEADKSFAGGIVGKGEGIYLGKSDQAAYDALAEWNSGTIKETPQDKAVILEGLKSVKAHESYAGGVAGYMGSAAFQGMLNDVVGLGDFIGFTASDITVTGVDGGYTVSADDYNAGGGFGLAVGGDITNVDLNELKRVQAYNRAGGFVGVAGPGELVGTGGLTVNLLGLDKVLAVSNLLNVGQGIEVQITNCTVTGIDGGFEAEATGNDYDSDAFDYTAAGFIADSNSTKIVNSHVEKLKSVKATADHGFAGGFIGSSQTGGLAEVANNDSTSVKSLIQADGLVKAIGYLIPSYTNCTTTFTDGGFVDADIAGGFVADLASGTVDNSGIASVDDAQNPKWTKTMKELYDPNAVNATGDLEKQFAVFNIDYVHGRTYGGGFGGKLRSGALASAGGGISILGNTGLSIDVEDLLGVMNAYVPFVKHAGVYSENGFTVVANTVRGDDPYSGSAGGFGGYMSGAQISHSDVYKLKNTKVTPPSDLEAVNAPSYFDNAQSTYAVTGGHFAGGYVGDMDIGSAASVGNGLKVLGNSIELTNAVSALSVVVSTIEHSDVQGAAGGFSVIADGTVNGGKVGMAGGYAGGVFGGHIQNSHCKNFYYIIGQEAAGGYVGNMEPGNAAKLLDNASILGSLVEVDSALASLVENFVPTIRNSTTSCVPCGGAVRAQSASDESHQRGCAGGYCGHNEGGHIWGLDTHTWEDQNDGVVAGRYFGHDREGEYTGERHTAAAWRIRSVYGYEYAGGFTGYMESADTADTGSIKLLGGLINANNVLSALSAVYPTETHTAVYGPLSNLDVDTWNAWVTYVGKYGGYGSELAQSGTAASQSALDGKLSKYIYGCNVAAGRSAHDNMLITEGGSAGGYVGYMVSGVITDGQAYDMKKIRAMRSAGGYAGKMQTGAAAEFGSVDIIGLELDLGNLVKAAQAFVPTVKSGSVRGWQSGMTVEALGNDFTHNCGYAGGYTGSAYGAQIWGDKNAGNTAGKGCNVNNLRFVRGNNAAGGYAGMATAASVADVNTNSSKGLLQDILNDLITTPGNLASVMQATVTTIRKAEVNPDNNSFGFTVDGLGGNHPRYAGGFAGSLEASVIGSRKGESEINVNGLRSVDGLYYAGGFVGLADVGSVASVSSDGTGSTSILNLIKAGSVDLLDMFRTYIYYSDVNGVPEGMVIRAYESAPEGILSEIRQSGCAGGFGGGVMNGTVKNSNVTGLNTVYAPNYSGGFIGHMGKNGAVDVDDAQVAGPLAGLNAGVLDVFGTVVDDCNVTGIDAGAVIMATGGSEPISGGFAGYADVSQIKNSHVKKLKQVYSDQIAGGFVGKTNMNYLVSAEVDSALVQQVLGIVNGLIRILQIDDLEKLDLLNLDLGILDLKLLTDGDVLYVNLLGLRIGVSLVKQGDGTTGTAVITIGDSTVELPYNENGIDTNAENAEIVVNLIKGNRTRVDNCSAEGILDGYDVYGGKASNTEDGTDAKGYAGGFVGYNKEGKFTSNNMVYCDVIRGTAKKTGIFSGTTTIDSVYSFNNLASIEKVDGEENRYSVYRNTNFVFALTARNEKIGYTVTDSSTGLKRFVVTHLESPIVPGANESDYYKIFEKWNGAKITSNASGEDSVLIRVYVDSAKAVLMLDTPTYENDESLIPNPGESKDPCGNIDLTIQKIWNDKNDADKSRPGSIRVRIWQNWENENGTPVMDGSNQKSVLFTDTDIIPDVDTTDGWFTLTKADHGRPGSATWTRVIKNLPVYINESDETVYFSYTVEEAPVFGYSNEITYDETGATATATIVNTPKEFEIQFKYYDRYEIDGIPSGIESEETVYSVPIKNIPKEFITYDSDQKVEAIDFWSLIGEKAVEFSENRLAVNNVMCKYDLWTSQGAAAADMRTRTYFVDGTAIRYGENTTYHTDYLGRPVNHEDYAGQEASKNEKWVNYYDSAGNELAEKFASPEDYIKVNKIVVWCYNYPRQYNVDIYGANSADDLVEKTVNGGKVYVANAKSADNDVKRLNDKYYYNQRFGEETGNEDQDAGGFIENYGLKRYTDVLPEDYAEESFGEYTFAYWAYNPEGTQIASVEREFWYRVTTDTKLYAVYAKSGSGNPGISISANKNDTFVDSSGVSKTRLNILGSVYGASEYDKDVQKLSFVNISLSTQIRDNPDVYTPKKINALFEQYKNQLKEIIKENDEKNGSKQFSSAETYSGDIDKDTREINSTLNLTLTTKGYIYTVVSNGNKPQTGDSTAKLTNKNRVQFTMSYKTSALNINNTGSNGNTCLMYCAALKYKGEWSVSSNCLIYYNGEVVDNTAESWE
ncbi:MAG: Cna B-type domain-containing protein [Ruminococcus sp.]|nr:Cna B-type domain-containing protein [Ruminococcus sp.]